MYEHLESFITAFIGENGMCHKMPRERIVPSELAVTEYLKRLGIANAGRCSLARGSANAGRCSLARGSANAGRCSLARGSANPKESEVKALVKALSEKFSGETNAITVCNSICHGSRGLGEGDEQVVYWFQIQPVQEEV